MDCDVVPRDLRYRSIVLVNKHWTAEDTGCSDFKRSRPKKISIRGESRTPSGRFEQAPTPTNWWLVALGFSLAMGALLGVMMLGGS